MPINPSNDPDIALAQEWLGELERWLAAHGAVGHDPAHMEAHALLALGRLRMHQLTKDDGPLETAQGHLQWLGEHGYARRWSEPFAVSGAEGDPTAPSPVALPGAIAGEAFLLAHRVTDAPEHLEAAQAIARHFLSDLPRVDEHENAFCFASGPGDCRALHNVNLLVARHLIEVAVETDDEAMARAGLGAVQYTINAQRSDGAFPEGALLPGVNHASARPNTVGHPHTGFVLRSLTAINAHTRNGVINDALKRGYAFYKTHLDASGMPHGGQGAPPAHIHASVEALLCHAALENEFMGARQQSVLALRWAWARMRDPKDGAPRRWKYKGATSKTPCPREDVAWTYRALAEYLWRFDAGR